VKIDFAAETLTYVKHSLENCRFSHANEKTEESGFEETHRYGSIVTVSCGVAIICTARNVSTGAQQLSQYMQERALG